jgi:hypothetical protein
MRTVPGLAGRHRWLERVTLRTTRWWARAAELDAAARLAAFVRQEWGGRLSQGWTDGWLHWPEEVGDQLGRAVLGAAPGQTVAADSTTVLFYKLVRAAVDAAPKGRVEIVCDTDNFPTDRFVLAGSPTRRPSPPPSTTRAASCCGTSATRRARWNWPWTTGPSTSPWAAPTSTSAAGRARRRSPTWPGATTGRCASRCRAGWATRTRSRWGRASSRRPPHLAPQRLPGDRRGPGGPAVPGAPRARREPGRAVHPGW